MKKLIIASLLLFSCEPKECYQNILIVDNNGTKTEYAAFEYTDVGLGFIIYQADTFVFALGQDIKEAKRECVY